MHLMPDICYYSEIKQYNNLIIPIFPIWRHEYLISVVDVEGLAEQVRMH